MQRKCNGNGTNESTMARRIVAIETPGQSTRKKN